MADGENTTSGSRVARERERKFAVHGRFEPPDIGDIKGIGGFEEVASLTLRAVYYDTDDLRLARHGATLRHRSGEPGGARWTVKLPSVGADGGDAFLDRTEIEMRGPASRIPAEAAELLLAVTRGAELGPVSDLRTRRRRWLVRNPDGAPAAELVQDEVSVMSGRKIVSRFRELELEQINLAAGRLASIADQLRAAGAVDAEPIPKVVRALGTRATAAPDLVMLRGDDGNRSAGDLVRATLRADVAGVVGHHAGTLLGETESLHQMRVATRRLRSDLRTFEPLTVGGWAAELRARLEPLASALGAVRDADVLDAALAGTQLEPPADIAAVRDALEAEAAGPRSRLRALLTGDAYVALLDALVAATSQPRLRRHADGDAATVLPPLLTRASGLARKGTDVADADADDADLHRLRIAAKRGRYAAEAIAPALRGGLAKDAMRVARRLRRLQGELGELQDSVVARDRLGALVADGPVDGRLAVTVGRLVEREVCRGAAARIAAARRICRARTALRRWRRRAA